MGIAVPNGLENGVFQLVKVALSSIVALFGTYQIAANGVAQSIWSMAALAGVAMGPAFTTVIGQCMGNGDTDVAVWHCLRYGGNRYCCRHGLRLAAPGSDLLPASKVREVEKLSGDQGMNHI